MRAEIVTGLQALSATATDWWDLFSRAAAPSPFQSPAWLLPWCGALGRGDPMAILLRNNGRLVGVAPFSLANENGERVLRPLGAGVTDLCEALFAAGMEASCARALLDALQAWPGWDRCLWTELPGGSPVLAEAAARGHLVEPGETAPLLRLPHGRRGPAKTIPRAMARNLSACSKRAEALGGVTIETPDPQIFLAELYRLHALRWRRAGQDGVLSHPQVRLFHREALPQLAKHGLARVHLLRIGGRVAAAHYGLAAGATHFYYIGGFDPDLKEVGPGHLAVAHAIERAKAEGATAFHFLRGVEAYKRRWGAEPELLHTLTVMRQGA
jgi:CelD/BcsL family acetyltransferase involved in cellulose biosynthesis